MTLDELRELKENWDGEGAPAPTEAAIQLAEKLLSMPPHAVPLTDGGIQIEWPTPGAEICITPEGTFELE